MSETDAHPWPLETVRLLDCAGALVDDWIGYLVPRYLDGIPNFDTRAAFTLEYECGTLWVLPAGDLHRVVWDALEVHEIWCRGSRNE